MKTSVEDFRLVRPELEPLLHDHWQELAGNKDHVKLDPRWDVYDAMCARDEIMMVTLRDDETDRLVGYFIGFVLPALHYQGCLELTTDIYRILPECRGHFGGVRLFRAVIAEAKRRGCQRFFAGTKLSSDQSRLFAALKFKPVETYHALWLGNS